MSFKSLDLTTTSSSSRPRTQKPHATHTAAPPKHTCTHTRAHIIDATKQTTLTARKTTATAAAVRHVTYRDEPPKIRNAPLRTRQPNWDRAEGHGVPPPGLTISRHVVSCKSNANKRLDTCPAIKHTHGQQELFHQARNDHECAVCAHEDASDSRAPAPTPTRQRSVKLAPATAATGSPPKTVAHGSHDTGTHRERRGKVGNASTQPPFPAPAATPNGAVGLRSRQHTQRNV